jgi:hypothetical protein
MPKRKAGSPLAGGPIFRRRGRPPKAFAGMNQAIQSLKSYVSGLMAQRAQLDAQIQAVEQALKVIGATTAAAAAPAMPPAAPAGKRGRPAGGGGVRPGSMKDYILKVLAGGRVMRVNEIAQAILDAGFKTKNQTLAKSVGIALAQMPQLKKVGRGKYRIK